MRQVSVALLSLGFFALPASARDDPPTPFSLTVTKAVPDWKAQDWYKGLLKLHPSKFNQHSDFFVEFAPEEPVAGRTMQQALESAWGNAEADDDPVSMAGAKEMGRDILAKTLRWEFAFDKNVSAWGIAKTARGTYLPFHLNCDTAHPDSYNAEQCMKSAITLLVLVQQGTLKLPDTPDPLVVTGWNSQYMSDGTSVLTRKGGLYSTRLATVYATAPAQVPAAALRDSITRFANGFVDKDDKTPGPISWRGTPQDPWIQRIFPEAYSGPAVQMAGSVHLPDGRTALVGVHCPNKAWLKECAFAVDRTLQAIRSGQVEQRREAVVAATQAPPPTNGIKDGEIAGMFTVGRNTMGTGGFMTGYSIDSFLYLRDGTVKREFDKPPAYIDRAASRRDEADQWGRWSRNGNQINVVWSDGDTDTVKVTPTNQMAAGQRGMKLSGRYRHVSGSGNIAFGGGNSVLSESEYTFLPDGTFVSDRSSSFMLGPGMNGIGVSAMGGSSGGGARGRYEVEGYTLKLTYPDGRVSRLSFAAYTHEMAKLSREGLMLNGTFYFLDDGK